MELLITIFAQTMRVYTFLMAIAIGVTLFMRLIGIHAAQFISAGTVSLALLLAAAVLVLLGDIVLFLSGRKEE